MEIRFLKEKLSLCQGGKTAKQGLEYDFLTVVTHIKGIFLGLNDTPSPYPLPISSIWYLIRVQISSKLYLNHLSGKQHFL